MIQTIYAVEISGVCNLSCAYCPYRMAQRKRGMMNAITLEMVCQWLKSGRLKAHKPLFLHLFGEPLLHPDFDHYAARIKEVWPHISFSTNGTKITRARARRLARIGFDYITVSPHKPQAAQEAFRLLTTAGMDCVMHGGPDHDWAGQVEHKTSWYGPCEFAEKKMAVVHWDGDVNICCIDDSKRGVIGSVYDEDLPTREHKRIALCNACHLIRPEDNKGDNVHGKANKAVSVCGLQAVPGQP